jgi:acetoin utilization deacetylase AcuC-like enzyme
VPASATDEQILLAHDPTYLTKVVNGELTAIEIRRIGLPWSPELVERSRRLVGGTISACRAALQDGIAVSLCGTHHAFRERGEGFCIFNDSAVAARVMQAEGRARRIAIVDCDVHQGNGTASILGVDPCVFTFLSTAAKNYPFHKERSDMDIELPDRTGDDAYLGRGGAVLPDAGVRQRRPGHLSCRRRPFAGDTLGAVVEQGWPGRSAHRLVFQLCRQAGLPVAVVMAGGYAKPIQDTVDIHFQTVRIAAEFSGSPVVGLG